MWSQVVAWVRGYEPTGFVLGMLALGFMGAVAYLVFTTPYRATLRADVRTLATRAADRRHESEQFRGRAVEGRVLGRKYDSARVERPRVTRPALSTAPPGVSEFPTGKAGLATRQRG